MSEHMSDRAAPLLHALVVAVLLSPLLPGAHAQLPPAETTLLVRPAEMQRITADPWLGGVWLGTTSGLFHKDLSTGELRHYLRGGGLPSQIVADVEPTPQGVWIATNRGVSLLDRMSGLATQATSPDGTPFKAQSSTLLAEGNNVWVGTGTEGLFRIDTATRVAVPVPNPINGSRFEHGILGLAADGPHLFISAVHYGLVSWNRATGQASLFDHSYFLDKPQYQRIAVSADHVWIATIGDGLVAMDRQSGDGSEWSSATTTGAPNVGGLLTLGDEVWMASGHGVARYTMSTQTWQNWRLDNTGQGSDDVTVVDGILYAINEREVYRFDRSSGVWSHEQWWTESRMVRHNVVQSCLDEGDRLAFGTGGGGLNFLDLATGRIIRAGPEDGDQGLPRDINILDVASDGTTRWLTTHMGVSELDIATGVYANYYTDGRTGNGRGQNVVRDVALDGDTIWFATSSKLQPKARPTEPDAWNLGNLARMVKGTRAMELYHTAAGLSNDNVTSVAPDGGRVWVGSVNGGLDALDKASNRITHVYPPGGTDTVLKMLLAPGGLWLATIGHGLVRVDRTTLVADQVPGFEGTPVTSMAWAEGLLWVGTAGQGIRAVDPGSLAIVDTYANGSTSDVWANCMVAHDGVLFLGSNWGIERFDLKARQFLPQITRWASDATAGQGSPTNTLGGADTISLTITSPAVDERIDPATPLAVQGTATGPTDARVLVRADDGPWFRAEGLEDWTVALPEAPGRVGSFTLSVRLEAPGQLLAFASRTLMFQDAGTGSPAAAAIADVRHTPILEAKIGVPVEFTVSLNAPVEDLQGTLYLQRPGSQVVEEIAMEGSDTLSAIVAPFSEAGTGTYAMALQWRDGSARLPAPLSGFGQSYGITVRPTSGQAVIRLVSEGETILGDGANATLRFSFQNIGSADATMAIAFKGPAAGWLVDPPSSAQVPAGESREFHVGLLVPLGTRAGEYAVEVVATAADGSDDQVDGRFLLNVGNGQAAAPAEGAPTLAWSALAALALAMSMRRRRR